MTVCFCLNNLGSVGLGATLSSLLKHCSDTSKIHFYFFCAAVNQPIKKAIKKLLVESNFKGEYEFVEFNPEADFRQLRSLLGDRTTYGKFLIPDYISTGKILYLDSDLLIETDVLELDNIDMNNTSLAAVGGTTFKFSLENNFYINELNIDENKISFNAGVLIIDVEKWREQRIKEKLLQLGQLHPNKLLSADQTLLNAFFVNKYTILPVQYNYPWYAAKKPIAKTGVIFHFVGSPKPWDFLGRWLHSGYTIWKKYDTGTWQQLRRQTIKQELKRYWAIRRSYIKLVMAKLKHS